MLNLPPYPTPYGLPIDGLDFGENLLRNEIAPGLTMSGGVSTQLAHLIAEDTGDTIRWPFAVVGFVDAGQRSLAMAVHYGGVHAEANVSPCSMGLPLTRRVLRILAERLFVECGLAAITVRVRPEADTVQWTLARLGFRASGRDDQPGPAARMIFTLDAETALRRAFPRGIAPPGKVC